MTSSRAVIAAGVVAVTLVVTRAAVERSDAVACSLSVVAVAGVVIVFALWHRPRKPIALALIAIACAAGLLG